MEKKKIPSQRKSFTCTPKHRGLNATIWSLLRWYVPYTTNNAQLSPPRISQRSPSEVKTEKQQQNTAQN